jgi:uncharacterized protein with GYD domain
MPVYLYQAAYTAESIAAQIKNPQDRLALVGSVLSSHGVTIVAGGYSMGEYDVCVILEAENDETTAAAALTLAAGGALRVAKTTKLLDGHQWIAALTKASEMAGAYRPAR